MLSRWTEFFRLRLTGPTARQLGRILFLYGGLGILVGLVASAFVPLAEFGVDRLLEMTVGHSGGAVPSIRWPSSGDLWLLFVPAIGGLLSGILCARWAPEAMGTGTGAVIEAYHLHGGVVRRRAPAAKFLASILTIGSGGSAGVEGPIGFIAAGLGSLLGGVFRLSSEDRRVLLMAGFAAGIGAVFHAPLAASLFAAEVLYKDLDLESEVLVPAIVSSTMAYAIYGAVHGWSPIWIVSPNIGMNSVLELIPYMGLALAVAIAARFFVFLEKWSKQHLGASPKFPLWLRPALGGLGVGTIALFVPGALGPGYGIAQLAIDGGEAAWVLLVLALAKMLTSVLTAGSGGSGGLFAPSLVIGALIGGVVARASEWIAPGFPLDHSAFAIVGMAGFFAAVINAPISTVIMVSELAGSYQLLVPTLWVCILAWMLLRNTSLYSEQVSSRIDAPSHLTDMMDSVLRRMPVSEVLGIQTEKVVSVALDLPTDKLVEIFSNNLQGVFPIVTKDTRVKGVVDRRAMTRAVRQEGLGTMLLAVDFLVPAVGCTPQESLDVVLKRMKSRDFDVLLVWDSDDHRGLLGLLSRREIIAAYHQRILERATQAELQTASLSKNIAPQEERAEATLVEALAVGDIVYGISAKNATSALEQLVQQANLPVEIDRTRLLGQLIERERLGSTSLGKGIAIPHPQADGFSDFGPARLLVATLNKDTPWCLDSEEDSPDADLVNTLLVILSPTGKVHLTLLSAVARSLQDPMTRRLLKQRVSKQRLSKHFKSLGF